MKLTDKLFEELNNGVTEEELAERMAAALNEAKRKITEEKVRLENERFAKVQEEKKKICEIISKNMNDYVRLSAPELAEYAHPLGGEVVEEILNNTIENIREEVQEYIVDKYIDDMGPCDCKECDCENECDCGEECCCCDEEPAEEEPVVEEKKDTGAHVTYTYDSYIKEKGKDPVREHKEYTDEDALKAIRKFFKR